MRDYIADSSNNAKKNTREKLIYGDKLVFLKDQLPYNFDLQYVLDMIENLIPAKDGALYVTNDQDSENDMIDDLIHEIAHAIEEKYGNLIYSDGKIEREFLNKRQSLWELLEREGYDPPQKKFYNTEYDKYFDHYLYNIVGYPLLENLIVGLFYSPYAITSINEYFANGFENYFLRDKAYLKNISPALYNKINDIMDSLEDNPNEMGV